MKIVKRKTRKAIRKSVKKVLKKHAVAAGLAGSAAAALAKLASTQAPVRKGKKPNLAVMSERVSEGSIGESRTKGRSAKKADKKSGRKMPR
jgi:hypothetical protein